ncbi:MAG: metal-dependent hydrolase [bacterium]|nr:metal-dependent hydrolase [bacterium]
MRETEITFLGHAAFAIKSPRGKRIVIDPWLQANPAVPEALKRIEAPDYVLITHGHFDHLGDSVEIARAHPKAVFVCNFEISVWLGAQGIPEANLIGMNTGGTLDLDGIKVSMVHADHSCGILDGGKIVYGGDPCGYVVVFENGFTLYHAGDTNVFSDMSLIRDLYHPEVALLPIGGHYTMGPREAAKACEYLQAPTVIAMHHHTFPALTGSPEELARLVGERCKVLGPKPGDRL